VILPGKRAEGVLLASATVVFLGGVVAALTMRAGDDGSPTSSPTSSPTRSPVPRSAPSPSAGPSATLAPPVVGAARIASLARGSHSLVVSVHVSGARSVALRNGTSVVPLRLVGSTASGTVPVDCAAPVPTWTLQLTAADGSVTTAALPSPAAAVALACAEPQPAGPIPTATRGS